MNAIIAVVCFIGALAAIIGSRITYIIVFSWWIGDNG